MVNKTVLKVAVVAIALMLFWPEIIHFINPKGKKKPDEDIEVDDVYVPEREDCSHVIYQPLSMSGLHTNDLLPKGYCYKGDSFFDDKPHQTGDAYSDEQADAFLKYKEAQSNTGNMDCIVLILNNTTAEAIEQTVGDAIGDESTWAVTDDTVYPVVDKDGNEYTVVTIGNQQWIVENFRSTKYADGSNIPNITNDAEWESDSTGAYAVYDNNSDNKSEYGLLYNWFAVDNAKGFAYLERNGVQETGWRVPTKEELDELLTFAGGDSVAGDKLRETGTDHWQPPNDDATNEYGFTLIGAGARRSDGSYTSIDWSCYLWSSTENEVSPFHAWMIYFNNGNIDRDDNSQDRRWGFTIRLVRDI
jgi:uncharacterized protein (TIGR02145 family)